MKLKQGEHAGPITVGNEYWFVYVDTLKQPPSKSLADVQVQLRRELEFERRNYATSKYRAKLFDTGNYDDLPSMVKAVMRVVESRYLPK
jgi:hypothetical protein